MTGTDAAPGAATTPDAEVRVARDGARARVVLHHPAKRNALTLAMVRALVAALADLDADPAIGVVVVTGSGDAFCSGLDLSSWDDDPDESPVALVGRLQSALTTLRTPVIAAIGGPAIGGGCQIAAACDLRIAVAGARIGIPASRAGIVYSADGLRVLRDLVGTSHTKRLLYTGDPIDAAEALRIGLVDRVVPADRLEAETSAAADLLLARSGVTIGATKELLALLDRGLPTADAEARWQALSDAGERAEGVAALRERRPPDFPSRRPR